MDRIERTFCKRQHSSCLFWSWMFQLIVWVHRAVQPSLFVPDQLDLNRRTLLDGSSERAGWKYEWRQSYPEGQHKPPQCHACRGRKGRNADVRLGTQGGSVVLDGRVRVGQREAREPPLGPQAVVGPRVFERRRGAESQHQRAPERAQCERGARAQRPGKRGNYYFILLSSCWCDCVTVLQRT